MGKGKNPVPWVDPKQLRGADKNTAEVLRWASEQGCWTARITKATHIQLRHTGGQVVVTGLTSSDQRANRACMSRMKRVMDGRQT